MFLTPLSTVTSPDNTFYETPWLSVLYKGRPRRSNVIKSLTVETIKINTHRCKGFLELQLIMPETTLMFEFFLY